MRPLIALTVCAALLAAAPAQAARKAPKKTTTTETTTDTSTTDTSTTDTSTTDTSTTCTPGWGTFGIDAWPGGCWRPYADSSPFNTPIPAAPRLAADSAATVSRLVGFGTPQHLVAGYAGTSYDYEHPLYYSQSTDPEFTLHCYETSWGTCPIEGHRIRIPDAARPAAGGDAHMSVIDQASGWQYDLYKVRSKPAGGGTLELRFGGRLPIASADASGVGGRATASSFGLAAGVIRAEEMEAGEIRHALFMAVKCTDRGAWVFPAQGGGRSCSSIGLSDADAPEAGTRFQLAMSDAEIDGLAVPAWKKTILRAMARYGMYVGDTGTSSWGLQFESGQTYTSFGRPDRMVEFAKSAGVAPYFSSSLDRTVYPFNLRDGVDWAGRLRVIDPCVTQGTC